MSDETNRATTASVSLKAQDKERLIELADEAGISLSAYMVTCGLERAGMKKMNISLNEADGFLLMPKKMTAEDLAHVVQILNAMERRGLPSSEE